MYLAIIRKKITFSLQCFISIIHFIAVLFAESGGAVGGGGVMGHP